MQLENYIFLTDTYSLTHKSTFLLFCCFYKPTHSPETCSYWFHRSCWNTTETTAQLTGKRSYIHLWGLLSPFWEKYEMTNSESRAASPGHKDETLLTDLQLWWMTNALLLCSLIVGEWMCLIWRERCRCYRRYNSQLRCESPRQTWTSVKETQSTPLFTLCRRCLPAWRRLPSLLCIWLQGSGSKRGSQEAGSGRPRLMKRSPLLSGVAGEVYCTLCIHTSDTRWRDVSGRRAANAGGGSLYRSRTRWQKSQELTESRWLQLMTFQLQERVFKAEIQQTIWH